MKRNIFYAFVILAGASLSSCDFIIKNKASYAEAVAFPELTLEEAEVLVQLPFTCITQEYPNKLGQVLASDEDLLPPRQLRPAFYGCFDWHSAVHAHWSLVVLLKQFPELEDATEIRNQLKTHFKQEHIAIEIAFFESKENASFERTYGWAWLFQLANELYTWEDELADELLFNLMPLTQLLEEKMMDFLPKLVYPIRSGEHPNTAFALSMSLDFARTFERKKLEDLILQRSKDFYLGDVGCPIHWEPGGYDFLSPCLEEAGLMSKVLDKSEYLQWLSNFLPDLVKNDFNLEVAEVSDRTDGKLVHLDGLNFSRAWNLFRIQQKLPQLAHLRNIAEVHFTYSYPNLVGDSYEGGHWLGSFALFSIMESQQ